MARKIFYSLIFLLIALCSSAFAEADLYAVHETLVDVSYKYRQPPQNFDTFDYDDWISYDQTARFFCLTLEVSDPDEDFSYYSEDPANNPPKFFNVNDPLTLKIAGDGYSYFNSYKLVKASNDMQFKLAPADMIRNDSKRAKRFGTSTIGYVPVNDMGEQIHCLVEADGGLNETTVTWNMYDSTDLYGEKIEKTATIPTFKTTAQQLNDFVPYIEYVREASDDFITQVRNAVDAVLAGNDAENNNQTFLNDNRNELGKVGAIKGFKWRFVKKVDGKIKTDVAISLNEKVHVQILGVYNDSMQVIYSSDFQPFEANNVIQGEVTFETGDNIPTIGTPPQCAIIRYYFDNSDKKIYQWRFVGHNVDDDPEKIDAVPSLTYGVNARLVDGKADYTYASVGGVDLGSVGALANPVEAKNLVEGTLTIPGGGYELLDDNLNVIREVPKGEDVELTLRTSGNFLGDSGLGALSFGPQSEGYRKVDYNYILNNCIQTRFIGFRDNDGVLAGKNITWNFPSGSGVKNGSATIPSYKSLEEQMKPGTGFFPYIEIVSKDGCLTEVKYRIVQSPDISKPVDLTALGVYCDLHINISDLDPSVGNVSLSNRFWVYTDTPASNDERYNSELYKYDFRTEGTITFTPDNANLDPNWPGATLYNLISPIKMMGPYIRISVKLNVYDRPNDNQDHYKEIINSNPGNRTPYIWNFTDYPPMADTQPMSDEDVETMSADKLIEAVSEDISGDDIHVVDRSELFKETEVTEGAESYLENDNSKMVGRFRQIYARNPGWVVIKVKLPDELFDAIKGFSADALKVYALTNSDINPQTEEPIQEEPNETNSSPLRFRLASTPKLIQHTPKILGDDSTTEKTGKLVALDGSKVGVINSQEFLMVSYLDSPGEKTNMYLGLDNDAKRVEPEPEIPADEEQEAIKLNASSTDITVYQGGSINIIVTAISGDNIVWSNSGTLPSGDFAVTSAEKTYTIKGTVAASATAGAYTYKVIASNDTNLTSVDIKITVVKAAEEETKTATTYTLSVTVSPDKLSLDKGAISGNTLTATATITPTVPTTPTYTYTWYSDTTASNSGGTAINSATSSTYAAPTSTTGTFYYFVVAKATVSGTALAASSDVITVTINAGGGGNGGNTSGDTTPDYSNMSSSDVAELAVDEDGTISQDVVDALVENLTKNSSGAVSVSDVANNEQLVAIYAASVKAKEGVLSLSTLPLDSLSGIGTLLSNIASANGTTTSEMTLDLAGQSNLLTKVAGLNNVSLKALSLKDNKYVETVDLSGATIPTVTLEDSAVEELTLGKTANVQKVEASGLSTLTSIDIEGNPYIEDLNINQTSISTLNAAGCTSLDNVAASGGSTPGGGSLEELDITSCDNLTQLDVENNKLLGVKKPSPSFAKSGFRFNAGGQRRSAPSGFALSTSMNFWSILRSLLGLGNLGTIPFTVTTTTVTFTNGGTLDDLTGIVTYTSTPTVFSYYYNPGFTTADTSAFTTAADGNSMDVQIGESSSSSTIDSSDVPLGGSGGGCDMSFGSGALSALMFMFALKKKGS